MTFGSSFIAFVFIVVAYVYQQLEKKKEELSVDQVDPGPTPFSSQLYFNFLIKNIEILTHKYYTNLLFLQ